MKKMWAGRTAGALSKIADDFNSSIHIDSVMYAEDIKGSMVHAAMLAETGIIAGDEADKIIEALAKIRVSVTAVAGGAISVYGRFADTSSN